MDWTKLGVFTNQLLLEAGLARSADFDVDAEGSGLDLKGGGVG